jgi:hypothetical protein
VPAEDIIEISSDEDDLQPPPKRALTKRGNSTFAESNYKAQLFSKDHEIERLKKVRHPPLAYYRFRV